MPYTTHGGEEAPPQQKPRPVPAPTPNTPDRGALPQAPAPAAPTGTGFHIVSIGPNPLAGYASIPQVKALRKPPDVGTPDTPPQSIHPSPINMNAVSGPQTVKAEIMRQAAFYKIPAAIALAVANQESGLNQTAVSSAGAIGIFQLMPSTAAGLHVDPTNWRENIKGGVMYLRMQYDHFGNWTQALAAYNAGPGAAADGSWRSIPQTAAYVPDVLATAKRIGSGKLNLAPGFTGTVKISAPLPGNPDVTSGYGYRGGGPGVAGFHYGVDLAANTGTPIHAMIGGTVYFAGPYGTGGNTVIIQDAQGRLWFYHHMVNAPPVSKGQKITPGEQIGNVGMTGDATGPHLHIGLEVNGKFLNPTATILKAFKVGWNKSANANISNLDFASPSNGGPDFSGGPVVAGSPSTTTFGGVANPALSNIPIPMPTDISEATRTPGQNSGAPQQTAAQSAAQQALQNISQTGPVSPEMQALMARAGLMAASAANSPGRVA